MKYIFTTLLLALSLTGLFANTDTNSTDTTAAYIYATAQVTHETTLGASDGAIDLTIHQGVAPFQLMWSNGEISEDIMNLTTGSYTVDIYDSEGTSGSFTFEVMLAFNPNDSIPNDSIPNDSITDPCFGFYANTYDTYVSEQGASDGAIDLQVYGGTAPFSFNWSNGAITEDLYNLAEGQYGVEITDANGCIYTTGTYIYVQIMDSIPNDSIPNDSIVDPCLGFYGYANGTYVTEQGASDGSIDLFVYGGAAPYVFDWSNGATTEDLYNLAEGQYAVEVTDANGCMFTTGTYIFAQVEDSTVWGNPIDTFDIEEPVDTCVEVMVNNAVINNYEVFADYIAMVWDVFDVEGNYVTSITVNYDGTINAPGLYQFSISIVPCNDTQNRSVQEVYTFNSQIYIDPAVATGVESIAPEQLEISLYPNPVKDFAKVSIQSKQSSSAQIQVISTNGQTVYLENIEILQGENTINLNATDYKKGIYLVRIQTDRKVSVSRFVK